MMTAPSSSRAAPRERSRLQALVQQHGAHAVRDRFTPAEWGAMLTRWDLWARPSQVAPTWPWRYWLILAGRGFGKTRSGAEWIRQRIAQGAGRIALVGRTVADVREVMLEGESGLLNVFPDHQRPIYQSTRRRVVFHNGAIATTYTAEEPDQLRGPQHDTAWCDELAAWDAATEAWDNLLFGLRLGADPRAVITTTPRPKKVLLDLVRDKHCAVTRGSTYDNAANLPDAFLDKIISRYEGTSLGRQELHAELLEDIPGALWNRALISKLRRAEGQVPALRRMVLAIDPSVSDGADSSETGIVIGGLGVDGHGYVIEDASLRGTPDAWARKALKRWKFHGVDRIVAEVNNGGALVEKVLRTIQPNFAYRPVNASRGKLTRAEPVSALYEQGKVHHVGIFGDLEDQMCTYDGTGKSPDRMDALVWCLSDLMFEGASAVGIDFGGNEQESHWRNI